MENNVRENGRSPLLFPPGSSRYTQIMSARCSTFLNSGSPVTMIALCSMAEARTKQSAYEMLY